MGKNIYQFQATNIKGIDEALDQYKGKVVVIVNTASKCGLTPQFKGLETLYETYKEKGLVILGFPCNQFNKQDPGSSEEIQEFCQLNYGVSFPMFEKIDVNGGKTHPLFKFLKSEAKGFAGSQSVKWNFTKFLVNKQGDVVKRFAPTDSPESLIKDIESLLAK
ncbi:MAG: glutathione peroxidase [Sinobacterium sp.]|nr:glutathione peroxidase [Sinobacterium sp.]